MRMGVDNCSDACGMVLAWDVTFAMACWIREIRVVYIRNDLERLSALCL